MSDLVIHMIVEALRALTVAEWLLWGTAAMLLTSCAGVFLLSAGAEAYLRFCAFMDKVAVFLGMGGSATVRAVLAGLGIVRELLVAALLLSTGPAFRRFRAWLIEARQLLRYTYEHAVTGKRPYPDFAAYQAAKASEAAEAAAAEGEMKAFSTAGPVAKPEDLPAFERAVAILGLTTEQARDMRTVRQRYRELMMIVHPDKQFPNQLFAQLVNEAVEILKRENGVA